MPAVRPFLTVAAGVTLGGFFHSLAIEAEAKNLQVPSAGAYKKGLLSSPSAGACRPSGNRKKSSFYFLFSFIIY